MSYYQSFYDAIGLHPDKPEEWRDGYREAWKQGRKPPERRETPLRANTTFMQGFTQGQQDCTLLTQQSSERGGNG